MGKALFKVLLKFIKSVADIILSPINLLVVNLVPDLSNIINVFNTAVNRYIGSMLGYFAYLLPPTTRTLVALYIGFLITYYTIVATAHGILKVINIIRAIKIW